MILIKSRATRNLSHLVPTRRARNSVSDFRFATGIAKSVLRTRVGTGGASGR